MTDREVPQHSQIGPYRILDCLGEGGMGKVYLAEQKEPVQRRVALKVIKLGMDSKAVVARFAQERQALALMQHDGIAKVYDCGTTESGQPFFAMEYVKGVPLVDYCDQHKLPLEERIGLLQQVCSAVQHAHQKGVVHRDLKPGNVLVDDQGDRPQVKVIDFGLAKAMGQKLGEQSMFTEKGVIVGTLEYMAPEQADPTNADIDTRADVYSLGVLVYETLTGQLPFSRQELLATGELEMRRILREVDPPRPSTRLLGLRDSAVAIAAQRQTSLGALRKALAVDLDWLVLKALEKDRNRRYATANALAMDLQRYLDHEPLEAGPPSAGYRLKKLARRYRVQLVTAGMVLGASLAFGGMAWVQYARAVASEKVAQQRAEQTEILAADKGRTVDQFNQLSAVVRLQDVLAAQETLWLDEADRGGWNARVGDLRAWLNGPCAQLLQQRPAIEATIAELRSRALPMTQEQVDAHRRSSPAFTAWDREARLVASIRRATAIREGAAALEAPELPIELRDADAAQLRLYAVPRVVPDGRKGDVAHRNIHGEEAIALVAARAAAAKSAGTDLELSCLEVLGWALVANGQDAEARQLAAGALTKARDAGRGGEATSFQAIVASIDSASARQAAAESRLAKLEAEVNRRRTWAFGTDPQGESARFLHDALVGVLVDIDGKLLSQKADVELRLQWAQSVDEAAAVLSRSRHPWAAVREAVAKADGLVASALYAGRQIPIPERGWPGLVPIGMNPATKLWEFYDLRSAWDGECDPAQIAIPQHHADGSIGMSDTTGIVFVLLPGGTFWMGAQAKDPSGPNHDPAAFEPEALHKVTLAPFLMARHEMTQGQWARLWTWDPRSRFPSLYKAGQTVVSTRITSWNPVEQVDWGMCDQVLKRYGMILPTEAQWEYACRAGTQTAWHAAPEDLSKVANLASAEAKETAGVVWTCEAWRDGHVVHAPVGSYLPNNFGLHDMHGNVLEWCRDGFGDYGCERPGDGFRETETSDYRITRGGSFLNVASVARSCCRAHYQPVMRYIYLGLRPCRLITR